MDRFILVLFGIACVLIPRSHASRSIENFPEIAEYIDLAINELSKRYELEIDQLHRELEENQRKFENEIAAIKKQSELAEQQYTKYYSDLKSDIDILENKVCPADLNGTNGSDGRNPAIDIPHHSKNSEGDKETQTQNAKRDLPNTEGSTNYYQEHATDVPIPRFIPVQSKVVVAEGDMAKLRCRIENLGTKMVSWRKTTEISPLTTGESTFSPDFRIEVAHEDIGETESEWDLIINDVRKHHAGVYECQISTTEAYTMNVTLTVLDPKKHKPVITVTGSKYVSIRGSVRLLCNVTGAFEAPDSVDWFFEGNPLDQVKPKWYGRLQVLPRKPLPGRSFISEIILEQATMRDGGNYVCRSGELANSFKVHVLNDTRPNHNERDVASQGAGYSMSDATRALHIHVKVLSTVCYILFRILLHS